jgi:hypothetical protein
VPRVRKRPLHERIGPLGWLRDKLRGLLFGFLRKLTGNDEARALGVAALRPLLPRRPRIPEGGVAVDVQPYADLGTAPRPGGAAVRDDVIFITARFRSGSTLLWNLFRHVDGFTSYYEPFNERRWFDPAARGTHTDPSHRRVEDYWREYHSLAFLGEHYRESWIDHNLYMDADSWDPAMKRYVELLIEHASGRPVLQFNRIDFRLPWFRHHFPRAKLVHLYRHPRNQWCSSLVDPSACPREATPADFARHDHYYLLNWVRDLADHFPFLGKVQAAHPYRLFYFVWKLSYLFGRWHAHYSLAFEDLTANPRVCLGELFRALNLSNVRPEDLEHLIETPQRDRWKSYAEDAWFRGHEAACEEVLAEFFRRTPPAPGPNRTSFSRSLLRARV